jgi:hypothetical protein
MEVTRPMTAMLAHPEATEAERLLALEGLAIVGTGREERFDRVTRLVQRLFGVEKAAIMLIDRDTQWLKSEVGIGVECTPREHAFCNITIAQPEPTVVEDTRSDLRFVRNPYVTGEPRVRFYAGVPLATSGGHRVGSLCVFDSAPRTFSAADREMLVELASWVENEMNRSAEMQRAAEVQQALLPDVEAIQVPGYDITGTCMPSRAVGGDLVDCYRIGEDVVVTLGDVMGKGIGAALMMATVRSAMRTASRQNAPGRAIGEAAITLEADLGTTSTIVTLCHARLTPSTGRLVWSDAGHGLMMLVRADGTSYRARGGGLPLGVVAEEHWPEREFVMEPGDTVVAFSDGLLDLFPSLDATCEFVADAAVGPPEDAVARIEDLARRSPLPDDVTVGVIRRCR